VRQIRHRWLGVGPAHRDGWALAAHRDPPGEWAVRCGDGVSILAISHDGRILSNQGVQIRDRQTHSSTNQWKRRSRRRATTCRPAETPRRNRTHHPRTDTTGDDLPVSHKHRVSRAPLPCQRRLARSPIRTRHRNISPTTRGNKDTNRRQQDHLRRLVSLYPTQEKGRYKPLRLSWRTGIRDIGLRERLVVVGLGDWVRGMVRY